MHERPDADISATTTPGCLMIFTSSSCLLTPLAAQELRDDGPPMPHLTNDAALPSTGRGLPHQQPRSLRPALVGRNVGLEAAGRGRRPAATARSVGKRRMR